MDRRTFVIAGAAAAAAMPLMIRAAETPSPADLKEDVAILRETLALHPGLYRYNTPAQIAANLDRFERAFIAAPDLDRRYLALAAFTATIRCGHSYANFFNQKKAVASALFDRPTRLPFTFQWIDGQMVVTGTQARELWLPAGSIVSAINDVPVAAMLRRMLPLVRADGGNDAKRRALLSMTGADTIETFDVFHGLLYGVPGSAKREPAAGFHRLRYRAPGTSRDAWVDTPALTLAERRSFMPPQPERGSTTPIWTWQMRDDGIALLTMPGWALYDSKWDWQGWLGERLDSLSGAKGLVIDLRENEGGLDCGDMILARLIDRDFAPIAFEQRLRFERTPPALDRYLDTWDDSFRTLGVGAPRLAGGYFARPGGGAALTIARSDKRITVPVAALIGPQNSSATFAFARNARESRTIRLYGGTTGGNRRGINGGAFFFVRLPASGLEFDLPLIGYFATTPQPDAGLAPDVAVAATAGDIAAGRDPVLARAIADILRA